MTKAWKILHHLRSVYQDYDDLDILAFLQLCDDREWAAIATAVGLKPTEDLKLSTEKGGTSCVVSRPVKAIVLTKLRGTGDALPVPRGVDALSGRRAIRPERHT